MSVQSDVPFPSENTDVPEELSKRTKACYDCLFNCFSCFCCNSLINTIANVVLFSGLETLNSLVIIGGRNQKKIQSLKSYSIPLFNEFTILFGFAGSITTLIMRIIKKLNNCIANKILFVHTIISKYICYISLFLNIYDFIMNSSVFREYNFLEYTYKEKDPDKETEEDKKYYYQYISELLNFSEYSNRTIKHGYYYDLHTFTYNQSIDVFPFVGFNKFPQGSDYFKISDLSHDRKISKEFGFHTIGLIILYLLIGRTLNSEIKRISNLVDSRIRIDTFLIDAGKIISSFTKKSFSFLKFIICLGSNMILIFIIQFFLSIAGVIFSFIRKKNFPGTIIKHNYICNKESSVYLYLYFIPLTMIFLCCILGGMEKKSCSCCFGPITPKQIIIFYEVLFYIFSVPSAIFAFIYSLPSFLSAKYLLYNKPYVYLNRWINQKSNLTYGEFSGANIIFNNLNISLLSNIKWDSINNSGIPIAYKIPFPEGIYHNKFDTALFLVDFFISLSFIILAFAPLFGWVGKFKDLNYDLFYENEQAVLENIENHPIEIRGEGCKRELSKSKSFENLVIAVRK